MSTLYAAETNPDEWFAELYFICRRLPAAYKCNTFDDVKMMNLIIYNTIPAAYQMLLTVIKDQLSNEDARFLKDAAYVREVTLESVMDEYRHIFESIHANKSKAHAKGSVMLVATPPPKGKQFPKQFNMS
jgi:hypothetical protein